MKLIVFGATGGTGRQVVKQALTQGHEVTAFVRDPNKLDNGTENLSVIQGDVMDRDSVVKAIEGKDVVVCALGASVCNNDKVRTNGTGVIVEAMQIAGVKRLICLSSLGAGDSRETLPWFYRYFFVPVVLHLPTTDHEGQEYLIKHSKLDWIIVRPSNLTDEEPKGNCHHDVTISDEKLSLKVSRGEVAAFLLKQVVDDTYLHKTPYISH